MNAPEMNRRSGDDESQAESERQVKARGHARALILDTARLISGEILPTRSGVEALRYLAEAARELTGARYAAIGVAQGEVKGEGSGFSDLVTAGFSPEEQAAFAASLPQAGADGILRLLLEREEPLRLKLALEGESFLGVPLRRGTVALGALYVTRKNQGQAFTDDDEANIQALGIHATVAIHNLRALERERALIAGLLTAHEEERRAIAYDLHDGLTQQVMAAQVHFEAFQYAQESGKSEKAAHEMAETSKYLQKAVTESRRLIGGLRSLVLDDLGLYGALEQLVSDKKDHAGWQKAQFECNFGVARFDPLLETAVYRIAQEALTNARKHAQTQWVKVSCDLERGAAGEEARLHLQIRDGGNGFDAAALAPSLNSREGVGLLSMRERTRMLNGSFELHSVPGAGTSLSASFPVPESASAEQNV